MQKALTKLAVVPMDGSKEAYKALNYIQTLYPADHNLKLALLHILPALPPIMVEEAKKHRRTAHQLKLMQDKHNILGWLEGFFTGEVTGKLVEISRICPIWVVKGEVRYAKDQTWIRPETC